MRQVYVLFLLTFLYLNANSQLNNGGLQASFGVDADTKGGYMKYGSSTGNITGDDWFAADAFSVGVIDTTNASYYRTLLQSNLNITFTRRMPVPLYTRVNGKIWLDAIYGRDYAVLPGSPDSTAFKTGAKNGDNPVMWAGGPSAVPNKTDLVDVYAHMRRNGTSMYDSLWFFAGATTIGTAGSRYFDVELYKNYITYYKNAGIFTPGGTSGGHTQWLFNASGNITQTGDMIVAVNYTGGTPVVEVRIWVSNATYTTVTPVLFNFGGSYSGSTSYGYASIVSKAGTTPFGSGIANISATPADDTTYSTPWGTHSLVGTTVQYGTNYESLQFIEVGLNFTRMGIDPALYTTLGASACQSSYASIFFKSRSSTSFTSSLQDFMGPLNFLQEPVLDYSVRSLDTISCKNPIGTIQIVNNTTAGYYTWSTSNGNITNATNNSINISSPGVYILQSSVAQGCPVSRRDTLTIQADTYQPVAQFFAGGTPDMTHIQLYGGDTAASNYNTPFGRSRGLSWNWSGPNGFTSTVQNPVANPNWGTYQLIVTEQRNGCTDTVTDYINFTLLSPVNLKLQAALVNTSVLLKWNAAANNNIDRFEIERSTNGRDFQKIGTMVAGQGDAAGNFFFTDAKPQKGVNDYRVKAISGSGQTFYSTLASVSTVNIEPERIYLQRNNITGKVGLVAITGQPATGKIIIYNSYGEMIYNKDVIIQKGQNNIDLSISGLQKNKIQTVSLLLNGRLAFSQNTIF